MNYNSNLSNIILKSNIIAYKTLKEIMFYINNINYFFLSKGYIGYLVECFYNYSFNNKANCDLPVLGIEIKTIALNEKKEPYNSIFICSLSQNMFLFNWEKSVLYNKIKHILWVPYYSYDKNILNYRFLKPFFYKMNNNDLNKIKKDSVELLNLFYFSEFLLLF